MNTIKQDDAVEILEGYTNLLKKEVHVSADDREETATTMVEALGITHYKFKMYVWIVSTHIMKNTLSNGLADILI